MGSRKEQGVPVKVSQQRIAKELSLSQALVSMVLNGRREGISDASYRRIWDHALRLGYKPKGMRLAGNGEGTARQIHVGFVLRSGLSLHTQSNYFSHIQHGLHEALQDQGISTVFLGAEDRVSETGFRLTRETSQSLYGVVIMGEVSPSFLSAIKELCGRVVAVSISYPGQCHSVQSNEGQSLDLLIRHLAELGHRQVAWIGGNCKLMRHADRYQALQDALRRHELQLGEAWSFLENDADRQEGRAAAERFLGQKGRKRPTALVCYNGMMARGAINFLQSRGLSVPGDLSVVAVDATRICKEEHPYITAASADPEAMGRKAAALLMQASGSSDEVYLDAVLPSQLTVRETTAPIR